MNTELVQSTFSKTLWAGAGLDVSLQEVLLAVALILGGGIISSILSKLIKRRFRDSTSRQLREQAPRWIFFVLWFLFVLAALRVMGVPLTLFNFLGGAIALGFGFGAQNLCSNLISGVIILVVRPYRVGDIVEVEDQAGTVLSIGLRATEVFTHDGVNLLVPNSSFLSNVIVNRTNFERSLRGIILISVAYGSDTRLVERTLCAVATAHPSVIHGPDKEPWVIFDNFGESALQFKLFFWVDTTKQKVTAVASDIRHAALAAFREKGIGIPYPQIVVHPST